LYSRVVSRLWQHREVTGVVGGSRWAGRNFSGQALQAAVSEPSA